MRRSHRGIVGRTLSIQKTLGSAALLLALLASAPPGAAQAPPAAEKPPFPPLSLPAGKVVERVECPDSPGQSYALYLPSGYTPDRPWPILYAFDPRANGAGVATLFSAGAERYGFIVASSNTSASDRADDPNPAALSAMWKDTHARFAVDNFRVYLTGMSGTVRAAIQLAHARPGVVTGILGAAAGWPFERRPDKGDRFVYYGTTAYGDFNYYEVLDLDEPLKALGLTHHFEVFEGVHQWPPAEIATRALGWFELQAMKAGLRAKEPAWIEAQWEEALARARAFESAGNLVLAEREYRQAGTDFAGLREAASGTAKADEIAKSSAFSQGTEHRLAVEKDEKAYLQSAPAILAAVNPVSGPVTAAQIVAALKVVDLRKRAADRSDPEASWSARRLLAALQGQTGFYLPTDFMAKKDYDRAIRILTVAIEINDKSSYPLVQRAIAYARKGDRKHALGDLEHAAELGWDDAAGVEAEEAFAPLRGEAAFGKALTKMRETASKPGS